MSKKIVLSIILFSLIYPKEYPLLTPNQQELISLKKQAIESSTTKLKSALVSPIALSASYSHSDPISGITSDTTGAGISFSQDIFKFGGMAFTLIYLDKTKESSLASLELESDTTYLGVLTNLVSYKQNQLKLQKSDLALQNYDMDIQTYKAKYVAGEIDITMLNNTLMQRNAEGLNNALLKTQIQTNLNDLSTYIDTASLQSIELPAITSVSKEQYIQNSHALHIASTKAEADSWNHISGITDYLPKLSVSATLGYQNINSSQNSADFEGDYSSYGLSLSMPLSLSMLGDLENTKVVSLQSKLAAIEKAKEVQNTYDSTQQTKALYNEKIALSRQNIKLYDELIALTSSKVYTGYAIKEDLLSMQNSKKMEELEEQINTLALYLQEAKIYYGSR